MRFRVGLGKELWRKFDGMGRKNKVVFFLLKKMGFGFSLMKILINYEFLDCRVIKVIVKIKLIRIYCIC